MDTPVLSSRVEIPTLRTPEPYTSLPPDGCHSSGLLQDDEYRELLQFHHMNVVSSVLMQQFTQDTPTVAGVVRIPVSAYPYTIEGEPIHAPIDAIDDDDDDEDSVSTEIIETEQNNDTRSVYSEEMCDGDPPDETNETDTSSIETLVQMLSTMNIQEMEEYGAEYQIDFNLCYDVANDENNYTHIMLTDDHVWLNVQNTFASETLPRFLVREVRYTTCAQYFVDCCLDGDMRYTGYPNGTTSYWVRLDMRPTRLMRTFLHLTRRGIVSEDRDWMSCMESFVDDLVGVIARDPPLNTYIRRVFIPERR